jgi:hypothetical protein
MKMEFSKFPGYCEFALTDQPSNHFGWHILDVIVGDHIQQINEVAGVVQPYQTGNGYYTPEKPFYAEKNVVLRRPFFLMGRPQEEVVSQQREQIRELGREISTLTEKCVKIEKAKASIEEDLKKSNEHHTYLYTNYSSANSKCRELENVIAKLRKAWGDKAVDEVLATGLGHA